MVERRLGRRYQFRKRAQLFTGASTVLDCVLTDISGAGAGLETIQFDAVPEDVVLTLDGGRTLRPSRLVWASSAGIGLAFKCSL